MSEERPSNSSYPNTADERRRFVLELASYLEYVGTTDPVAIDLSAVSSVTDFFVIATVNSRAQLKGVIELLKKFMTHGDVKPRTRERSPGEAGWLLLDCDFVVIHLMTKDMRDFYELEKLWFQADRVYPPDTEV